jgi:hypothetical protein
LPEEPANFQLQKTWEFSGQKFCFLFFSRLPENGLASFFMRFHFPLSSFFSQVIQNLLLTTQVVGPPVFPGLGRSEFDTKSNSTHAIYIYIYEQPSSRAADWKFF